MDKVFELRGRVVTPHGNPIPNLRLAIVDKDPFIDDLLGVGVTNNNGEFYLSFTQSEFNQEPFERETVPDIYIVFSVYRSGQYVPIDRQNFFGLKFEKGSEDLREIVSKNWGDRTLVLQNQNPTPGLDKKVSRLKIDNDLVSHCLREVTPMVENITGWKGLLDKTSIFVGNEKSFRRHSRQVLKSIGIKEAGPIRLLSKWPPKAYAAYDPFQKRIYINERMVKRCNLDGLKVILGHELVHLGQYLENPRLVDVARNTILDLVKKLDELMENTVKELFEKSGKPFKEIFGQLYNNIYALGEKRSDPYNRRIEGYAYFIQLDFLQRYYNCALIIPHFSLLYRVLSRFTKKAKIRYEEFENLERQLYLNEVNKYRLLRGNRITPRFYIQT